MSVVAAADASADLQRRPHGASQSRRFARILETERGRPAVADSLDESVGLVQERLAEPLEEIDLAGDPAAAAALERQRNLGNGPAKLDRPLAPTIVIDAS